jgi:glucose-fructose oxidoreductase
MNDKLTRRTIIKSAAAAVAAPYVITSAALGQGDTPPASERILIGHIGLGGQGRGLFRRFQRCNGMQSIATSDAYKTRRDSTAAACKGKAYADFQELLAIKDIDGVVVATPDHWHVPVANAAARAGKDCYVEKPLGVSIEQDLACRKIFQEKKRIFQYGTQQRSSRHCWLGCELVRRGLLGDLTRIEVIAPNGKPGGSTKEVPVPEDLDYDRWIGPAPMVPFTANRCNPPGTYMIYDYSIGYLGGWGAHPLDIMVWGSDADISGMIEIEGTGKIPTEGLHDTVYDWDMKGKLGKVEFTFKPGGDSTKFIGPKGWIQVRRGGIKASDPEMLKTVIDPAGAKLQFSTNHYQNFVDAIKSRKPAVSPIEDSVRSDIISLLCDIAVRKERKITWDPKKEVIVGDADAAKMIHRDMRAPWTL